MMAPLADRCLTSFIEEAARTIHFPFGLVDEGPPSRRNDSLDEAGRYLEAQQARQSLGAPKFSSALPQKLPAVFSNIV